MSTTQTDIRLNQILSAIHDIKSSDTTGRVFDVLEVIRDQVSDLQHEHEAIRGEIRSVTNLLVQQQLMGAD